jgi:short-subunit dehydrogenase
MTLGDYFKSKRVMITGASSGIGAALAVRMSDWGADLVLVGRNQERLTEVAGKCVGNTTLIFGDLAVPEVISEIRNSAQTSRLDIVVLNAGTAAYDYSGTFNANQFKMLIESNLTTMVNCIDAVLPSLMRSKGQLALMSSLAAYGGLPNSSGYGAGKAAIRLLAQSLDIDLRHLGVPVTCICPGFVKTPLTDRNSFPMPFLIDADSAAIRIAKGLTGQAHEINFPKRFSMILKLLMSLPAAWQYHLIRWSTSRMSVH